MVRPGNHSGESGPVRSPKKLERIGSRPYVTSNRLGANSPGMVFVRILQYRECFWVNRTDRTWDSHEEHNRNERRAPLKIELIKQTWTLRCALIAPTRGKVGPWTCAQALIIRKTQRLSESNYGFYGWIAHIGWRRRKSELRIFDRLHLRKAFLHPPSCWPSCSFDFIIDRSSIRSRPKMPRKRKKRKKKKRGCYIQLWTPWTSSWRAVECLVFRVKYQRDLSCGWISTPIVTVGQPRWFDELEW